MSPTKSAGYSGTPLWRKLGIREGYSVALVAAPENLEQTLGPLPERVRLRRRGSEAADLVIWFVRKSAELRNAASIAERAGSGGVWIAWPKKRSGIATDLSGQMVREAGLAAGLVDYKVCAIDATWSGLRFARRKA